ncbi:MAG: phosphatidylserine decarboxylase [Chromatiales bacterium]|jgi:phosphatidylserine decarboxylase|nr:phosphatidylserine decarboxylase [Chromatiales bacterium]
MPTPADRLFVLFQRLLPAQLLGLGVERLAAVRAPWFKDWQIRTFVRTYGIDVAEAARPVPSGYPTLNDFFVRELRPGARPVDPAPGAVVSPADGRIEQAGTVTGGHLIQAKGFRYSAATLLATTPDDAGRFDGGSFATIYLAPWDYHRVHMPLGGTVTGVVHVPGRRLAVNPRTVGAVPGLFAANERVVVRCEHAAGPFAVVLVGALNVASIGLAFAGTVRGNGDGSIRRMEPQAGGRPVSLATGDWLGQFNLGSTVIVLGGRGLLQWRSGLAPGETVRVGERLGTLAPPPPA